MVANVNNRIFSLPRCACGRVSTCLCCCGVVKVASCDQEECKKQAIFSAMAIMERLLELCKTGKVT